MKLATLSANHFNGIGDIVQLSVLGTPFVVLNTFKAASDLFGKRGAIYSDRPPLLMHTQMCG